MNKDPIELLIRLVETPSVSGNEAAVVDLIRAELAALGLAPVVSGRNVWCAVEGRRPGKTLLFEPHIDTVPSSPAWTSDPWKAVRANGRVQGLGANDVKGGAAAMIFAIRELAKDRDFITWRAEHPVVPAVPRPPAERAGARPVRTADRA